VESLDVHGMIMLRVKSEEYGRVIVVIDNKESRNIQLQVKSSFNHFSKINSDFLDTSESR
jgi:AICAR transformylase/IMP cyclohydrolase PurH